MLEVNDFNTAECRGVNIGAATVNGLSLSLSRSLTAVVVCYNVGLD